MKRGIVFVLLGFLSLSLVILANYHHESETINTPDSGWDYDYGGGSSGGSSGGYDYGGSGGSRSRTPGSAKPWSEYSTIAKVFIILGAVILIGLVLVGLVILAMYSINNYKQQLKYYSLGKVVFVTVLISILIIILHQLFFHTEDAETEFTIASIVILLFLFISVPGAALPVLLKLFFKSKKGILRKNVNQKVLDKYGINKEELLNEAFVIYKDVQEAWMNFDYKKLRKNLSDELFNNYQVLLEALKLKNQKNIMEDITLVDSSIADIKDNNDILTIIVDMRVKQKDYVINKRNKVVRGKANIMANVYYELTFTMGKMIEDVACPNCSTKLSTKESNICPSCGTVVINKKHDLIMVKKEVLSQK